jgi:hypothetical protein
MRKRKATLIAGAVLMTIVALHPPWTARGVTNRMNFDGFPQRPPSTVIDTVRWSVPFAPLYSPPELGLPPDEYASFQRRIAARDPGASLAFRTATEKRERRYHVPDTLRAVWYEDTSGTTRSVAFRRSLVSTEFTLDWQRLVVHLLVLVVLIAALATLAGAMDEREH